MNYTISKGVVFGSNISSILKTRAFTLSLHNREPKN
jgi:hypothetical protein